MRKVLIVITTGLSPTGGLTTVIMNYYRKMNREGLIIDFASNNTGKDIEALSKEMYGNGSHYYYLGNRKSILIYFIKLYRLCRGYDVIHINGNSATTTIELLAAWMAGIKVRIDHNHTSKTEHPIIHTLLLPLFRKLYTIGLACSENAGNWIFGKGNFIVLRNAIDTDKYRYSVELREKYRKEFDIPLDTCVIGNVGKYNPIKNHHKLIDVFNNFHETHKNSMLVCVGYGPLQKDLEKYIDELGLAGKVILTGERTDIQGFLSAMDVFVFPSKYEGFGMAVVEAQISGMPCLLSDRVPHDVMMSDYVQFVPLEKSSAEWASLIDLSIVMNREKQSRCNIESITAAGYNIKTEAGRLRDIYL